MKKKEFKAKKRKKIIPPTVLWVSLHDHRPDLGDKGPPDNFAAFRSLENALKYADRQDEVLGAYVFVSGDVIEVLVKERLV